MELSVELSYKLCLYFNIVKFNKLVLHIMAEKFFQKLYILYFIFSCFS